MSAQRLLPAAVLLAAAGMSLLMVPPEEALGRMVRLVYLHAAMAETSIACFVLAAIAGPADLARSRSSGWGRHLFSSALYVFALQLAVGTLSMKALWGGFIWSEPKIRVSLVLFLFALASEILLEVVRHRAIHLACYLGAGLLAVVTLTFTSDIFHPRNAILGSSSGMMRGLYAVLSLCALGLTLIFTAWHRDKDDGTRPSPG